MRQLKAAAVRVLLSCFCSLILLPAVYARAEPPDQKPFDIDPQALAAALSDFARQSGREILYTPEVVADRRSNELRGSHEPIAALKVLLKGSGLDFTTTPSGAILIGPPVSGSPASSTPPSATSAKESGEVLHGATPTASAEVHSRTRLAQETAATDESGNSSRTRELRKLTLEEIVVTAQKRLERLQDVPVPVTVISGESLLDRNQLRLQDYFTRIPGLNFQAGSRSEPIISIRGINSLGSPTVAIMVDDVPYGPTVFRGGGFTAPDIDPSDVARIEVLRGPQGTLYGVASLGGLIKYVTVDPSTDGMSGSLRAGASNVSKGRELGYSTRGAINVPLSETFAVRASAFTRLDPGYIDNIQTNTKDVNQADSSGARLAALLEPSEELSLKLSALYQERNIDGAHLSQPTLGDLKQNYLVDSGWLRTKAQAYSATLAAKLGSIELTSLSGYNVNRFNSSIDVTTIAAGFYSGIANTNFGVLGVPYIEDYEAEKLSQEIRLASSIGERLEWLLGGFYTDENFSRAQTDILAVDQSTGAPAGVLAHAVGKGGYEEYAAFANLTVHFTDRTDIQFGARQSHNSQNYSEIDVGVTQLYGPSGRLVIPNSIIEDSPLTYLVTPRFKISPDLMLYARLASGYRAGGINTNAARGFPVPGGFDSDRTYNYEVGIKGNVLDQVLSFEMSMFHIDWKDLQVNLRSGGANYQDNASRAESRGVDLSIEARPLPGLTLTSSMSYSDAELTESFGSLSPFRGLPGDRLPFTSEFAGSLSIDQEFQFAGGSIGFAGGLVTYVGERTGLFQTTATRQKYPAYMQVDLHAGMGFESWRAQLFVTNLSDKRGLVGGGLGQTYPNMFNYIQPRTLGVSLSKTF